MPLPAAKKMSVCPFTSPSEGDRKSTRLNSSHSQISYAVFFFKKRTRLNSSHSQISYAVFCLKKKKNKEHHQSSDVAASLAIRHELAFDLLSLPTVKEHDKPTS